jgi:hypothetical protein
LLLIVLSFLLPASAGAKEIRLRCEVDIASYTTEFLTRPLRDIVEPYVHVRGTTFGDFIDVYTFDVAFDGFPRLFRMKYTLTAIGDVIQGVRVDGGANPPYRVGAISIEPNGKMSIRHLFTKRETHGMWNAEKHQIGGFDGDTWFETIYKCVPMTWIPPLPEPAD